MDDKDRKDLPERDCPDFAGDGNAVLRMGVDELKDRSIGLLVNKGG